MRLRQAGKSTTLDTVAETDNEQSTLASQSLKQRVVPRKRQIRKRGRLQRHKFNFLTLDYSIMRFRLLRIKRTLRVICFNEKQLKWPKKFTKMLNNVSIDNDQESCDEIIDNQLNRAQEFLQQGIQQNNLKNYPEKLQNQTSMEESD